MPVLVTNRSSTQETVGFKIEVLGWFHGAQDGPIWFRCVMNLLRLVNLGQLHACR